MRSLTNRKAVVVDRWPWLLQTNIPRPLDYPIRSHAQAWWVLDLFCEFNGSFEHICRDVASGIVGALYADGWRESFESLQRLINALRRQ